MNENVEIIVGGRSYRRFTSYTIDAGIYNAAGMFDIELHPSCAATINKGDRCTIRVGGVTVLEGLVDRVGMSGGKNSLNLNIGGRDLMGLVVDTCIETFTTLRNKTLQEVAEYFLRQIDYVKRLPITFIDGADELDISQEYVQPTPGMTVFELLSGIAASRGLHFYLRPEGDLVFGRPQGFGNYIFSIWRTADDNCNFTRFNYNDDLSRRYSRVTVLGQAQSTPTTALSQINKKATATDNSFPFAKPLVVETQTAAQTLSQQARMILEQQRHDGFSVDYTVKGHTQRGWVWTIDAVCGVDDKRIPLQGEFLIYGRSFVLSKGEKSTTVTLGYRGVAG